MTQTGKYFYKICLFVFLPRPCCYIWTTIRHSISTCFISFFCRHRKKCEKEREIEGKLVSNLRKVRFGLVIGQKRKRSGIKIRVLKLVSHSLGGVFKVPHARTLLTTFPAFELKKYFPILH